MTPNNKIYSGTYISKLVVPEVRLVALQQLNGQITVLPVTLLHTDFMASVRANRNTCRSGQTSRYESF